MPEFEWNEEKRLANAQKHKIDFADAVEIFKGDTITPHSAPVFAVLNNYRFRPENGQKPVEKCQNHGLVNANLHESHRMLS